ncbi:hypothetical protein DERP_011225 [Dermatophagoides pteronyssinus]|uniref:Uncharacterized protein n=1 Tax=Dermatophagoides pteronyssinus TaxID=6956 RepID=A0ABQ8JCG8_DERPT|nr:hypothetical protein DERP_011225 [Dermatophagoides pteronyssinus]
MNCNDDDGGVLGKYFDNDDKHIVHKSLNAILGFDIFIVNILASLSNYGQSKPPYRKFILSMDFFILLFSKLIDKQIPLSLN